MHSSRALPELALIACLATSLAATSTSAASPNDVVAQSSARTHAASGSRSSAADVLRVFRALKVNLVSRTAGDSSQPVTVLSAVVAGKPARTPPWSVEIFIYPSSAIASEAFAAVIGSWRDSGIPATRANNLIVTVVPNGRSIGAAAPAFPMPQLVREALRALARTSS
jgi:hypothetical protein